MDITQVLTILEAAGIDLTGREIAEAVWLAQFLPQLPVSNSLNETQDINDTSEFVGSNFTEEAKTVLSKVPERESGTDLYSNNQINTQNNTPTSNIVPAAKVRIYSGRALPNARAIARALRPLMRRIPSKIDYELDEKATAQQIAEKYLLNLRVWAPVLKPAPTRWLEVALVVDNSTSMAVWQPVADELYSLLVRQGAFRDVRMWRLDTESEMAPQLFYANNDIESAPRSYQELFDASGKRLIIVLSDCVSKAWQDKRMFSWLAKLAPRANVTILQVWPQRLWKRTILGYVNTLVSARSPALPNTQLIVEQRSAFGLSSKFLNKVTNEPKRVPITIVALEPHAISNWARMVAGVGNVWAPAIQVEIDSSLQDNQDLENQDVDNNIESDPRYLVEHFQATALPLTQKLAGLLASVPLQLPIMRLIQNSLLPSSEILHLSEFLTSGLIYRVQDDTDNPIFEFVEGVRDLLRRTVSISESVKALQEVGKYINEHFGEGESFAVLIPNVNGVESLVLKEQTIPFAQLQAEVLESLGGIHRFTAQQVREKISQFEVVQHEVVSFEENLPDENLYDNKAIRQLYNVFDPFYILSAGNPAYVDCTDVRSGQDILLDIGKDILLSSEKTCQLYSGHRGAGKSTELLRLQKYLDDLGFFVVYFAADEQDIEPQDVEYSDILLACTRRILEALKGKGNSNSVREWVKNLFEDLKDIIPDISFKEIEIEKDIPTFAKITAKIHTEPAQRRKIRNLINPHTQTLIQALNQFINDARKKLSEQYEDIVLIVDNLDRIVPIMYEDRRSNHEQIFLDHNEQLKALDCHLIYTVPISLVYSDNGAKLQDTYADIPFVLPMVMVHTPENQTHERGLNIFKKLLQERVKTVNSNMSIVSLFENPQNLDELCLMSGGHLRNLIILMREAIKYTDTLPISTKAVQKSIAQLRNTYHNTVYPNEWETLASVFLSKKIKNDNSHLTLLFNRCILEYRYLDADNQVRYWYDVHPIIRDIDDFQAALQKLM